jgi:hypothetical protein
LFKNREILRGVQDDGHYIKFCINNSKFDGFKKKGYYKRINLQGAFSGENS